MEIKDTKDKTGGVKMKSEDRVSNCYIKGTTDWKAQYDMLLDDGVTCGDCAHSLRCKTIFGGNDSNTHCQFYPNRFFSASRKIKENKNEID